MKEMRRVREKGKKKRVAKNAKPKKPGRRKKTISKAKRDELVLRALDPGMKDKHLAAFAGWSPATFYRNMQFDPELKELLKEAKEKAVENVEVAMYAAAMGYEHDEVTYEPMLVMSRVKNGVAEKVVMNKELVATKVVRKFEPPNAKLVETIMFNKMRKDYKNRSLIGMDQENPIPFALVTPGFKGGLINGARVVLAADNKKR